MMIQDFYPESDARCPRHAIHGGPKVLVGTGVAGTLSYLQVRTRCPRWMRELGLSAKKTMAQIWKEKLNADRHRDFMAGAQDAGGLPVEELRDNLLTSWVYFVKTPDCELQFIDREHVVEAKRYFEDKIHPARREWNNGLEHYWQRWFERLPAGVHREPNRKRVFEALNKLVEAIDADSLNERH